MNEQEAREILDTLARIQVMIDTGTLRQEYVDWTRLRADATEAARVLGWLREEHNDIKISGGRAWSGAAASWQVYCRACKTRWTFGTKAQAERHAQRHQQECSSIAPPQPRSAARVGRVPLVGRIMA